MQINWIKLGGSIFRNFLGGSQNGKGRGRMALVLFRETFIKQGIGLAEIYKSLTFVTVHGSLTRKILQKRKYLKKFSKILVRKKEKKLPKISKSRPCRNLMITWKTILKLATLVVRWPFQNILKMRKSKDILMQLELVLQKVERGPWLLLTVIQISFIQVHKNMSPYHMMHII